MVFNAGELTIVEYGVNEAIGTCRTEKHGSKYDSARLNMRFKSSEEVIPPIIA